MKFYSKGSEFALVHFDEVYYNDEECVVFRILSEDPNILKVMNKAEFEGSYTQVGEWKQNIPEKPKDEKGAEEGK